MKRVEFVIWAGKQGWKHGQKYLNKAYNYFIDKGKIPDPNVILQKAKKYTSPRFLADKRPSAKIIPFPKKPPGKADGGRIDKALSTRSRDI